MTPGTQRSVFVIGDSISVHYGPYLESALEGTCTYDRKGGSAEALANLDVPCGSNGGDSAMVLEYVTEQLATADFRPDLMLINAGLHDIKRAEAQAPPFIDLTAYSENLRQIVRALKSREIKAVWMRTTPCRDDIHNEKNHPGFFRFERDLDSYNDAADSVMQELAVPVIDLHRFTMSLEDDPRGLFCDHVHFHHPVRARQGAFLAGWITAYFSGDRP